MLSPTRQRPRKTYVFLTESRRYSDKRSATRCSYSSVPVFNTHLKWWSFGFSTQKTRLCAGRMDIENVRKSCRETFLKVSRQRTAKEEAVLFTPSISDEKLPERLQNETSTMSKNSLPLKLCRKKKSSSLVSTCDVTRVSCILSFTRTDFRIMSTDRKISSC